MVHTVAKVSGTRENPINVLAKAGALLDALDEHGELTPTELATCLGEPRSSVYRLLDSLERLRFVEPGLIRGTVQLGIKLYRLGNSAVRNRDLRAAAAPHMLELRDKTESTVFLAIRHGDEALCIDRIEGRTTVNNALLPGLGGPLHIGAVGKVLLAAEPPTFWNEYAKRTGLPGYTEYSITGAKELVRTLQEVRDRGFAISDEDRLLGMAGVGAPIYNHDGAVCAAISFSGPRPLVLGARQDASIQLAVDSASSISSALGYRAPAATAA
jgi:DNA-binding IclR family transcriptional regulator